LQRTGRFELLGAVELESTFCRTLEINRDAGRFGEHDTQILCADLTSLDPFEFMDELGLRQGELDLLVGGPPCQAWSTAGKRGTVGDPRGQLIWRFLEFVDALKPRMFLMENVRGLLSGALLHRPIKDRPDKGGPELSPEERPGSAINAWAEDLHKIDNGAYRVDVFEVNAVNYGAPQLRERVMFVGNRLGKVIDFPAPTHGTKAGQKQHKTMGEALDGFVEANPVLMDFSPRKKKFLSLIPPGGNWRSLPDEVAMQSMGAAYYAKGGRSGWWRRLSWDLPSPTITTLPNHSSTSLCHPTETRVLSVGECARIQEFPDGWVFDGSPQQQMAQVGNAVPVKLGEVAGELIADHLDRPTLGRNRKDRSVVLRRMYVNSHVRTRSWWKNGQAVIFDAGSGVGWYQQPQRGEPRTSR
jgi:DNA (cytosine-5)-methyltransferase 1